MNSGSSEKFLDEAPFGYAYRQIVTDNKGKPVDYIFLDVNSEFEKISGLDRRNILHKNASEVCSGMGEEDFNWVEYYGSIAMNQDTCEFEQYVEPLKKLYKVCVFSPAPEYFVTLFSDITDRRETEGELKSSKEKCALSEKNFRTFFETVGDMIFIGNQEGVIIYSNSAVTRTLGYSREELSGMHMVELYSPGDREEVEKIFAEMCSGGGDTHLLTLQSKSGDSFPVESRLWFGEWDGKKSVFGVSKDLSKEQTAQEKFNKIFSRNPALMAVSNSRDYRFTEVNDEFIKKLGYTKEEIIGKTAGDLGLFVQPEKQLKIVEELQKRGSVKNRELKVKAKDGTILEGLFSGEIIDSQGDPSFLTVMTDITDQKEAEEALEEANRHLEEQTVIAKEMAAQADLASKAKSDFLANMSHEIRTPMNAVVGFTDLLLTTELAPIQRQYLENVHSSADALLVLINDILDFSKIEAGRLELEYTMIDLHDTLEKAMDIVSFKAQEKGLELILDLDPELPFLVSADSVRLNQIITNLLTNAVKFTEQGEVELKAVCASPETPNTVIFSIRDTGIGMSLDQKEKVFDSFTQADYSTTRKYGGTGLGLSISKSLVEKMGGILQVETEPNKGSTFSFALSFNVEEMKVNGAEPAFRLKSALIVDDNKKYRTILDAMCSHWGINGVTVSNGIEALEILKNGPPVDVIILDYHLPFMDGLEVLKKIRQELGFTVKDLPVVFLYSSTDDQKMLERYREFGIEYMLMKPIKMKQLQNALEKIETGGENSSPVEFTSSSAQIQYDEDPPEKGADDAVCVVVAEDNPPNMLLARGLLLKIIPQAVIIEAKNGIEAVELFKEHKPQFVLMDVQMPELDGFNATAEIREYEEEKGGHTPVIALTAGALEGDREKCLNAGMDDYLSKPILLESLRKKVHQYVDRGREEASREKTETGAGKSIIEVARLYLYSQGHDDEIISQMFEMLLTRAPELKDEIQHSIDGHDGDGLKRSAHSAKGILNTIGMEKAAQYALEIEKSVDVGDMNGAEQRARVLLQEMSELIKLIKLDRK